VVAALGAVDDKGDAGRLFLVGPDDLGLVQEVALTTRCSGQRRRRPGSIVP
jgi:hypothetical protein